MSCGPPHPPRPHPQAASKLKSISLPSAERCANQACVANSLPGWTIRPTMLPTAAAICGRFKPSSRSLSSKPHWRITDSAVCSTPALRGVALRQGLARVAQARLDQRALTAHQLVDARGQCRPLILRQIEVAAQVEPRGLLDAATHTGAVHEPVGDVGLAGVAIAGWGAANEPRPMVHGNAGKRSPR